MRSLHWPGLRRAWAALAAAGCLALAACGGGGSTPAASASPKPTATATRPAEPVSGAAAVAAITANWKTVFNGKAPIPRRLALVQNGSQLAAFIEAQAKTSFGQAAKGSSAKVTSVLISSPTQATVHWDLLLLGTPLLKNQVGNAVYLDGVWKVSIASFCGLAYLEYPKGSPKLPAACRS
ncbi:MAG TPA: hypothetical protein VFQ68_01725 [Streptosporangiaceae bacterium]|nr:hypothetical protein [Streptosporangiaceae bacterium]